MLTAFARIPTLNERKRVPRKVKGHDAVMGSLFKGRMGVCLRRSHGEESWGSASFPR